MTWSFWCFYASNEYIIASRSIIFCSTLKNIKILPTSMHEFPSLFHNQILFIFNWVQLNGSENISDYMWEITIYETTNNLLHKNIITLCYL